MWVLGFVSLLTDLSSEIYHALLPAFVTVALALPVAALGAIDGISEATASFAKLASGRLSDRSRARKPWVLLGYGMAALSKPLFAIATTGGMVLFARFADRLGKGIRGAPRDALIADETPAEIRGRAFGLRQALDTVGAVLAPLAAVALMYAFSGDIRAVFWIAAIPAALAFVLLLLGLKEHRRERSDAPRQPFFAGFRDLSRPTRRVLGIGFLLMLARFSEGFLVLRGMDLGLSPALSPLVMTVFAAGFLALAYPAGALSDRVRPQAILTGGIAVLIAGDLILAGDFGIPGLVAGTLLWGVHMALTQGHFRADGRRQRARPPARDQLRRVPFRHRDCDLAGERRRGAAVGPRRRRGGVYGWGGHRRRGAGDAYVFCPSRALTDDDRLAAARAEWWHSVTDAVPDEERLVDSGGDVKADQGDGSPHQQLMDSAGQLAGGFVDSGNHRQGDVADQRREPVVRAAGHRDQAGQRQGDHQKIEQAMGPHTGEAAPARHVRRIGRRRIAQAIAQPEQRQHQDGCADGLVPGEELGARRPLLHSWKVKPSQTCTSSSTTTSQCMVAAKFE